MGDNDKLSEGLGSCSMKARLVDDQEKEQEKKDTNLASYSAKSPLLTESQKKIWVNLDQSASSPGKVVALLLGPSKTIVAYGTKIVAIDKLHGAPMPEDCFRVSVDEVVDDDALLPHRVSDEIVTVGSALATHVAWPRQLVVERSDENLAPSKKKKVGKKLFLEKKVKEVVFLPPSLRALRLVMDKSFDGGETGMRITVDFEVFGMDIAVWLLSADIVHFCELQPITGNCIVVYQCHLYKNRMKNDTNKKFMLVNPFSISSTFGTTEKRGRALGDRLLKASPDQLVLAPCNIGAHWILIIVDPHKLQVYWMDPLSSRKRDKDLVSVVETGLSIFKENQGEKSNIKKSTSWKSIQGNKQPDALQCGFYVMRYMKQIIEGFASKKTISFESLAFDKTSYTEVEIDEVREEWADFVLQQV